MKYVMIFLFCIGISIGLVGCDSIYETHYSYQAPVSVAADKCLSQCVQAKNACQKSCQIRDQNCRRQAHQEAYYRYSHYRDYQTAHGLPIQKQLNEFDTSYSRCNRTCDCINIFNACYRGCGGVVSISHLKVE